MTAELEQQPACQGLLCSADTTHPFCASSEPLVEKSEKDFKDQGNPIKRVDTQYGFPIFVSEKDKTVSHILARDKMWQCEIGTSITDFANPGDTVVHAGSHIGIFDVFVAKHIGVNGHLYSFEPNPEMLDICQKNLIVNGIQNTITYKLGVSDAPSSVKLCFDYSNTGHGHFQLSNTRYDKCYDANIVDLDSCLRSKIDNMDLLFMDIEGIEIKAIAGAQNLIQNSKDPIAIMEWSPKMMSEQGSDVSKFVKHQLENGYKFYQITSHRCVNTYVELDYNGIMLQRHMDVIMYKGDLKNKLNAKSKSVVKEIAKEVVQAVTPTEPSTKKIYAFNAFKILNNPNRDVSAEIEKKVDIEPTLQQTNQETPVANINAQDNISVCAFDTNLVAKSEQQFKDDGNPVTKVITRYGFPIYVSSNDKMVSEVIIRDKVWQGEMITVFKDFINKDYTIVHLGAHIGFFDAYLAFAVGSQGHIYSFEPNPEMFDICQKNIAVNNIQNIVSAYKLGVSDSDYNTKLCFNYKNTGAGHFALSNQKYDKCYDVQTVDLDKCIGSKINNIDVLFMDIEGGEIKAMNGAKQLLENSKDPIVIMEWSHRMLNEQGSNVANFVKQKMADGFKFYEITTRNDVATYITLNLRGLTMNHKHMDIIMYKGDLRSKINKGSKSIVVG